MTSPTPSTKVRLELEEHDARIVSSLLVLAHHVLTNEELLVFIQATGSRRTNSIMQASLGLLSGARTSSEIPQSYEDFEAVVETNLQRLLQLVKSVLNQTDRSLVERYEKSFNPRG